MARLEVQNQNQQQVRTTMKLVEKEGAERAFGLSLFSVKKESDVIIFLSHSFSSSIGNCFFLCVRARNVYSFPSSRATSPWKWKQTFKGNEEKKCFIKSTFNATRMWGKESWLVCLSKCLLSAGKRKLLISYFFFFLVDSIHQYSVCGYLRIYDPLWSMLSPGVGQITQPTFCQVCFKPFS